ncbi:hypothetical protein HY485_02615 [Candidatus Woesearchaeota archaeon]|nr:hypothetical protein [Candidatus Woesearchaeota archaeon]
MLIVKDAMVVIHLAKTLLLEHSCKFFGGVLISKLVYEEIMHGEKEHGEDVIELKKAFHDKLIKIKQVRDTALIEKSYQYNIYRGEAEAVALYWQERADFLATDDDNVRKKKDALSIKLIGTPAIIMRLFQLKCIEKNEYLLAVKKLKEIGWFASTVFDRMMLEVNKNE